MCVDTAPIAVILGDLQRTPGVSRRLPLGVVHWLALPRSYLSQYLLLFSRWIDNTVVISPDVRLWEFDKTAD